MTDTADRIRRIGLDYEAGLITGSDADASLLELVLESDFFDHLGLLTKAQLAVLREFARKAMRCPEDVNVITEGAIWQTGVDMEKVKAEMRQRGFEIGKRLQAFFFPLPQ